MEVRYEREGALRFRHRYIIRHGGDRARYVPSKDFITLPQTSDFQTYEHHLATAPHELCRWSGAKHRPNRDLNNRFQTRSYTAEELIAEFGAALLCAHLEVKGQLRHSEYIANWLQLLRDDDRAVFTAASKVSQAADYLRAFSEEVAEAA
jgi:antirestriction protein ArdC